MRFKTRTSRGSCARKCPSATRYPPASRPSLRGILEENPGSRGPGRRLDRAAKAAKRLLREELEKYRWRYEGSAALKEIQNAIEELREINQELRQQPWHSNKKTLTEQERAKVQLARAWEKELERAAAESAHRLFETAKQKDATLAERTLALNATTKIEGSSNPPFRSSPPRSSRIAGKDEMAGQIDQRLNEISDRYRELNDLQERIHREAIAAEARQALPAARGFERAQKASNTEAPAQKHEAMREAVAEVLQAQRVAGDYAEAQRLEDLAGESPEKAQGKETAQLVRDLANRTERNPPSLARDIPPPMREQTQALENQTETPQESAETLAKPRLAMELESGRLRFQGDRKTAVAYSLLGSDLGTLIETPDKLSASTLQPLADRAAALAGEKGEEARQAEIQAANERLRGNWRKTRLTRPKRWPDASKRLPPSPKMPPATRQTQTARGPTG